MFDERAELLDAYEATPVILPILLRELREGDPPIRPASREWSAVEVVAHLADAEDRALGRVIRMLQEDGPKLAAYDPAQLAIDSAYTSMTVEDALERFQRTRTAHAIQLKALDDEAWARTGLHLEVGEISIQQLTAHMVGHDLLHMAQLARLLQNGAEKIGLPALPDLGP